MPETDERFFAYACGLGRAHGHMVEARSYEAAAVEYAELHQPPVDAADEVRIFVQRVADGREHCFVVDVAEARTEACA